MGRKKDPKAILRRAREKDCNANYSIGLVGSDCNIWKDADMQTSTVGYYATSMQVWLAIRRLQVQLHSDLLPLLACALRNACASHGRLALMT
jgi:hypothetical protein